MVFILAPLKSVDTKHSEQSKTRTRHVIGSVLTRRNSSLLQPPGLYGKADKSSPCFVVVLVLSIGCGFLCLIPVGLF